MFTECDDVIISGGSYGDLGQVPNTCYLVAQLYYDWTVSFSVSMCTEYDDVIISGVLYGDTGQVTNLHYLIQITLLCQGTLLHCIFVHC